MRQSWEHITEVANTDKGLNAADTVSFHYFNLAGLYAEKAAIDERIRALVEAGTIKEGWLIAHGSLDGSADKLISLVNKKVTRKQVNQACFFIRYAIERAEKALSKI